MYVPSKCIIHYEESGVSVCFECYYGMLLFVGILGICGLWVKA